MQESTRNWRSRARRRRSNPALLLPLSQGALADAQASVAANPAWVKGHFRSAKALAGLQRHEAALQAALQALALEPGNAQVQQLVVELQAQQPLQQQQLPWQQLRALRATLDLQRLPQQLVVGSRYLPSPDGVNSNLLLLLHGLGDTPKAFTGAHAKRTGWGWAAPCLLAGVPCMLAAAAADMQAAHARAAPLRPCSSASLPACSAGAAHSAAADSMPGAVGAARGARD